MKVPVGGPSKDLHKARGSEVGEWGNWGSGGRLFLGYRCLLSVGIRPARLHRNGQVRERRGR